MFTQEGVSSKNGWICRSFLLNWKVSLSHQRCRRKKFTLDRMNFDQNSHELETLPRDPNLTSVRAYAYGCRCGDTLNCWLRCSQQFEYWSKIAITQPFPTFSILTFGSGIQQSTPRHQMQTSEESSEWIAISMNVKFWWWNQNVVLFVWGRLNVDIEHLKLYSVDATVCCVCVSCECVKYIGSHDGYPGLSLHPPWNN